MDFPVLTISLLPGGLLSTYPIIPSPSLESIHKRYLYQSFLERLRWRLHWEAICIMPPQWRQTEASYADIASQNPPQNSKKIRKKVMKESYERKLWKKVMNKKLCRYCVSESSSKLKEDKKESWNIQLTLSSLLIHKCRAKKNDFIFCKNLSCVNYNWVNSCEM